MGGSDIPRMAQLYSMLEIFNAALVSQGYQEIVSENDGSAEFRVLSRNWPAIVEAELEDGAYYFAREEAVLNNRTPGGYGFKHAFLTPLNSIHVRRVWLTDQEWREVDWVQDGTRIHTNQEGPIRIQFLTVSDPHLWSANFVRGVQMKLEAVLLRALKEEAAEAGAMEQQAEIYFQRARTNSSKARSTKPPMHLGQIAGARFGRG